MAALSVVATLTALVAQAPIDVEIREIEFTTREGPRVTTRVGEGFLTVPERWEAPGGRSIRIHFLRFRSTNPNPGAPIVYLAGGPGGSGSFSAAGDRFPLFQALREVADVIALDQRGVYGSDPYLVCPGDYDLPLDAPRNPGRDTPILEAFARRCSEHFRAQGVDLAAYHTLASADDLEALRRALGAERLNLWAISYGTHLALAMIRRHPGSVERAVLAGVEGTDHTLKLPSAMDRVFMRFDSVVRADPRTRAFLPDPAGTVRRLLEELRREPRVVRRGRRQITIGPLDLQELLVGQMGERPDYVDLPRRIAAVARGEWGEVADAVAGRRTDQRRLAMSISVDCASGASPDRLARIDRERDASLLGDAVNFPFPAICVGWPHNDLGPDFRAAVRSDVPVLFISGTLDVRTPFENAEEVAAGFPNGRHLVIEGGSHDDDLFLSSPHIVAAMRIFFARGTPDVTRIALPPIGFRRP